MDMPILEEVRDGKFVGYIGGNDIRNFSKEELISYILIRERQMLETHASHRKDLETLGAF